MLYNSLFSATKVAFVNYQVISLGEISKANDNSSIKLVELSTDDIDDISDYDMVFINAMGLRITEAQRAIIQSAADGGTPILTTAATNPANLIVSLDSIDADSVRRYLTNGGRRNYRSMLNYVRKDIDGKLYNIAEPEAVVLRSTDMLYHKDPAHMDDEEIGFNSVAAYDAFLAENGLLLEGAPRIVVTGVMGEPTDLIAALEATGNVVYAVRQMSQFVKGHHIDSVAPSAIINMAHGRMGEYIVNYLKAQNIPLFAPLNVNRLVSDWEADKMGMSGGFLSQSVVTPEIDGAIRPQVLFGNYIDDEGLQHTYAIPERLETFVATVNNYVSLSRKTNAEKRVAIYYYKGPGQSALTAAGLEVGSSLYNVLLRLKAEGYDVSGLPSSSKELERMIQAQGAVFGTYAEGAFDAFMASGAPAVVSSEEYERWSADALSDAARAEVSSLYGPFPGEYMTTEDGGIGVARLQFGNIVLLPQSLAGTGDDAFKIIHGTDAAPPYAYIASYLWTRYAFGADAIIHAGTHGSLEFTPRKQAALSHDDWSDALIGSLPHFYIYSIGDVGEGVIAKRRSYAGLQSHLTPPFMESALRDTYKGLTAAIKKYNGATDDAARDAASLEVKAAAVELGIHRALGLDSVLTTPYTADAINRIESFGEEVVNEKVTGQLYTLGVPYESARITSSVYAMCTDPIAYSLLALDKLDGRAEAGLEKHASLFSARYLEPARALVTQLLASPSAATDAFVCRVARISADDLAKAREIDAQVNSPVSMMERMMNIASEAPAEASSHAELPAGHPDVSKMPEAMRKMMRKKMAAAMKVKQPDMGSAMKAMLGQKDYSREEVHRAQAIMEVVRTLQNVGVYKRLLEAAPEAELASLINALDGGYTAPSPGGDVIANPNVLPTGRNLFAINAEETPTEDAWEKGKALAESTIAMYRERHNDSLPRKVSYTLWSGEFIESGGATIAQVLYMLGVEPIRDTFGRVTDLRLIPSADLGRPRIDVVVQTSGQLRDIAASRLFLINRAVEMAAAAADDAYPNEVAVGLVEAERVLTDKGLSPREAREVALYRVFGGVNGGYGTGIQGMVTAGDRWDDEGEIAEVYLNNMGAYYGSEKAWEDVRQYAFEAALSRTDAVIQPRQSNTWGALSLDHVYEFMGGMNLAVRNVTGKDPDAYLSDYRNRNHARMQEVGEAIGVESTTTLFNPAYIREKMKGGATSASTFAELVTNTYGWNVMKPDVIDNAMWDEIYEVYVRDKHNLGVKTFFERESPAALEEVTAVMMESARKGMWKATDAQLSEIAALHTELVNKYKPSCSGFVCDNAKLREFIAERADASAATEYKDNITAIREAQTKDGMVMKREELSTEQSETHAVSNIAVIVIVIIAVVVIIALVRRRRSQ